MPVFNVVKFRVKPGLEAHFLDAHRGGKANWPGLVRGVMIMTGERRIVWLANGLTRTH